MRLLRLELVLCVVCCVASCARPTLDELDDAAIVEDAGTDASKSIAQPDAAVAQPDKDAGSVVIENPPRDTGTPVFTLPSSDAGNTSDDGGDTLPPVLANCNANTIANSVPVGQATVGSIKINGTARTVAQVKPGASVALSVSLTIEGCDGAYSAQSLFVGVNDGSNEECQTTPGCSGVVPISYTFPAFNFDITAPATPGVYYVMAGLKATFCAGGNGNSSVANTPVAALCVSAD